MDSDRSGLGLIAVIAGMTAFVVAASLFLFVLVFMNDASGGSVLHGVGNPDDVGPPLTAGIAGAVAVIAAMVLPRLLLRPIQRRIDGPRRLENYGAVLFLATTAVAVLAQLLGFIAAFMTQELIHLAVILLFSLLPVVLVWPTDGRRAKWAAGGRGGA